jgi:hypothetical protein
VELYRNPEVALKVGDVAPPVNVVEPVTLSVDESVVEPVTLSVPPTVAFPATPSVDESVVMPLTPSVPFTWTFPLNVVAFRVEGIMFAVSAQNEGEVVAPVQFPSTQVDVTNEPKSGPTIFLKKGAPDPPFGEAKIWLAAWLVRLKVHVPVVVIGPQPEEVNNSAGGTIVIDVTVPPTAITRY